MSEKPPQLVLTKKSMLTGKSHTRVIPITGAQYEEWRIKRPLIQDAFPHLSEDDREFILTGVTPEEWNAAFKEDDDDGF